MTSHLFMGALLCPITGERIDKLNCSERREILIQVGESQQDAVLLGEARLRTCTLQGSIYWTPSRQGGERRRKIQIARG